MTYLIFGNGWLGNMLKDYLGGRIYEGNILGFTGSVDLEDVWINTAAKTNIDWVEKHKSESENINVHGAEFIARQAKYFNKKYVFFSSACIFESKGMIDVKYEDSIPNPQCFYSKTKAMAEELIQEVNPDALIIRPRLPLSEVPHPRNTLNKLKKYERINDNQESVTIVEDMLPVLKDLIQMDAKGIYHLVNEGTISPHEIAVLLGHPHEVWSKEEQDKQLAKEGRPKRVTTYVGSKRIPLLPDIRKRIKEVIKDYANFDNRK